MVAVGNVIARLPGSGEAGSVLFVAHYDSVASGPGAGDNGLSVAAMLEAIRALSVGGPLPNDLLFLFTDGEEYGMHGALAFVEESPHAENVRVALNFDTNSGTGPLVLRFTSAGDGWLARQLATARGGAFLKSQQNSERDERWGSDFGVLALAGIPVAELNSWSANAYYHTALDSTANLDQRKLQAYGEAMVRLARHFGAADLSAPPEGDHVFTSVFTQNLVVRYPNSWTWPLTAITVVGLAAVLALGLRRHRIQLKPLAASAGLVLLLAVAALALGGLAWSAIVESHPEAVWQQDRDIYQGRLLVTGILALMLAAFLLFFSWAARRLGTANLQAGALALTGILSLFGAATDPLFSYLLLWPLIGLTIAAGVSLLVLSVKPSWLSDAVQWLGAVPVLAVLVPMLARYISLTPWQGPATSQDGPGLAAAFMVLLPGLLAPMVATVIPRGRPWVAGGIAAAGVALLVIGTARAGISAAQQEVLFAALKKLAGQVSAGETANISHILRDWRFAITGTTSWPAAQVTAGGVEVKEIHGRTMESKIVPGLYFAGEIVDIDGDCGGYNLQWAWSSGYVAGASAATLQRQ